MRSSYYFLINIIFTKHDNKYNNIKLFSFLNIQ